MTLKDVAVLANYSVSTVSKAINGAKDVSDGTRQTILSIAEQVGYFADKKSITLKNKSKSSFTVAVVCPEIISIYYSERVTLISREVEKLGGSCIVYVFNFDYDKLKKIIEECDNNKNINAIIYIGLISEVSVKNTPLLADKKSISSSVGVEKAVEYIKKLGHTDIGFVGEPLTVHKERTFYKCHNGKYIFRSSERFEKAGEQAAEHFIKNGLPTAVVCAYDEIAFGLTDVLTKNGIRVPEDVSVMGINNIKASKYCFGGLTTVETGWSETLNESVRELYRLVAENKKEVIGRFSNGTVYVEARATTLPPKSKTIG